jgi:hypothetical protein
MSQDARNSIYLWIGSLSVFGLLWANMSFDLLPVPKIPDEWLWVIVGIVVFVNVAIEIANYRGRRRAAKAESENYQ